MPKGIRTSLTTKGAVSGTSYIKGGSGQKYAVNRENQIQRMRARAPKPLAVEIIL